MNKANLNFVIDALMFLCMTAIAGLILHRKMIPGLYPRLIANSRTRWRIALSST